MKQIRQIYHSKQWSEVIIGGWDTVENNYLSFISKRKHNAVVCESSGYESVTTGIKGFVKRILMRRYTKVYATGQMAGEIFKRLHFKGKIVYTGGCGILNYVEQPPYEQRKEVRKFLYVGRLITVKNLQFLISVFNELPDLELNIIGEGVLKEELQAMAKANVHLLGYVNNKDLPQYYRSNDVFILASLSEPWGLVVEEALNNGTPVMVSDRVGCNKDLVTKDTGLIFEYNNKESLMQAIEQMTDVDFYNRLRLGVSKMNFQQRAEKQVDSYFKK